MPSKDPKIQKAYKDKVISKGQYDKLSDGLLLGIIKKKGGKAPAKNNALKETRKKTGKAKGKAGRPKKGSKVEVV
tara:strand:+ start:306 stop:530 length:225 start_codon:yes stop_codon:yes gene_type:complete